MSTFSRRLSIKILAALLVFSLAYAPVALLPQLGIQDALAQGEGGQNNGNAGGATIDISNDMVGIDSQGQLDGPATISVSVNGGGFGNFASFVIDALTPTVVQIAVIAATGQTLGRGITGYDNPLSNAVSSAVGSLGGSGDRSSGTASVGTSAGIVDQAANDLGLSASGSDRTDFGNASLGVGTNPSDGSGSRGREGDAPLYYDWNQRAGDAQDFLRSVNRYFDVSFSADKSNVVPGESLTLSWRSESGGGAQFRPVCYGAGLDGGWAGPKDPNGTYVIPSVPSGQPYVSFLLTCTRQVIIYRSDTAGGDDVSYEQGVASVTVPVRNSAPIASTTPGRPQTVQPQPVRPQTSGSSSDSAQGLSISASPSSVARGGQTTLSWSSEGNSSCSLSGGWPGSITEGAARSGRDASGVSRIFNILETSTYRLSCVGADGVTRAVSATVNVR
ncbi:hypothetical protein K8Q93_01320 [Candidatus Parcubacteria bacterium]|nr:hypothetical protein [Candidatus Parcubacteria bacterium]